MSIRLKLFLFSALIGIVPLLVLSFFSYSNMSKSIQDKTFAEMSSINKLSHNMIMEWSEGSLTLLESLAQRPLVRLAVEELTGPDSTKSDQNLKQTLVNSHFTPALNMQNNLNVLSIIDLTGKIIVSTSFALEGQFRNHEPYFTEGLERSFLGSVRHAIDKNETFMHVGTPIRNNEGETVAVLTAHLNWSRASTLLSFVTQDRSQLESYLVSRKSLILTESKFIKDAPLKLSVSTTGVQNCIDSGRGQGIYQNYLGTNVLGVYQWLPDHEICLLTESDFSEQKIAFDDLRSKVFGTLLLLTGLAILFALFIASTLSKPIRALITGAEELGQGNLDHRVVEMGGEIGLVQAALNQMADNLSKVLASRNELNKEVEQRKLTEQYLNRVMTDLKKSNQDLERFAYVASHDLQEPLRTITSYLQLLEKRYADSLDSEAEEFIAFVVEAASRMKIQINDLLNYSRVGRNEKEFTEVDLNQIIAKIIQENEILILEADATLNIDKLPILRGSAVQISLLFQNLISNALKFKRSGVAPQINITAEKIEGFWHIQVADNGIGIEPQYIERIFIIFQRLHSMSEYPGTGIGLALCKRIVENHEGIIDVTSTPGNGSTFILKFCIDSNQTEPPDSEQKT
jgi:signal transduction histidine kinase